MTAKWRVGGRDARAIERRAARRRLFGGGWRARQRGMKILGIDCSGLVAGVAVAEDGQLVGEYTVNYKKKHSQILMPMLDDLSRMIDLDLSTLDAVAVAGGPGSFTGLRIGSSTAKGLGLALGIPIASVPTVDALAFNLAGHRDLVCPLMDARRGQAYTGLYRFRQNEMEILTPQRAAGIEDVAAEINGRGEPAVFLGDGVPVFAGRLGELLRVPYSFAPAHLSRQRAGSVAVLGMRYFSEGRAVPAEEHRPEYLRPSQAEREREEREKGESGGGGTVGAPLESESARC